MSRGVLLSKLDRAYLRVLMHTLLQGQFAKGDRTQAIYRRILNKLRRHERALLRRTPKERT